VYNIETNANPTTEKYVKTNSTCDSMKNKCNNGEVCLPEDLKNPGDYLCRNFSKKKFDVITREKSAQKKLFEANSARQLMYVIKKLDNNITNSRRWRENIFFKLLRINKLYRRFMRNEYSKSFRFLKKTMRSRSWRNKKINLTFGNEAELNYFNEIIQNNTALSRSLRKSYFKALFGLGSNKITKMFSNAKFPCFLHKRFLRTVYEEQRKTWEIHCTKEGLYSTNKQFCWKSRCKCVGEKGNYLRKKPNSLKKC